MSTVRREERGFLAGCARERVSPPKRSVFPADLLGLRENTHIPVTVRGEALFRQDTLCKRRRRRTHAFFFFSENPFQGDLI